MDLLEKQKIVSVLARYWKSISSQLADLEHFHTISSPHSPRSLVLLTVIFISADPITALS